MSLRVLIVEDEVIVALELQSHLENLGYEVVGSVTSGEEAVLHADALQPDLVLMDVRLSGKMDGIEAARQIRARYEVPIIFLTAFGDEQTLERAKAVGPFGYLLKPFEERDLFATIEVALSKHRTQRQLTERLDDLQQILDGLRLGTLMTDERGGITFLSQAAYHLLGHSADDALGRLWTDVLPFRRDTLEGIREQLGRPADRRTKIGTHIDRPDGRRFWTEVEVQNDPRNPARHIFMLYDVTEVHDLREQLDARGRYRDIIGQSEPMRQVFQQIEAVAGVDTTVLIEGETGTGKELVAKALHHASHRRKGPFIAVNCAALTETLAASQLFGHKKGAFTGAISDSPGFFGAADGGTLFLDEIGDIPMDVQVNLLRVLEQRTVTRVGETRSRPVNVRIVAASHRNLPEEVEKGNFRMDLLYRIRVARVELPPLSQRQGDIPLLVRSFLGSCASRLGKAITEVSHEAMRSLLDYRWPGNVRELRNAIEYAIIRAQSPVLQREDLPPEIRTVGQPAIAGLTDSDSEKERILAALAHTRGNRKEAASLLGVSRATFYRRLTEHGL